MESDLPELMIRLVVGGNAILEVGRAHVVVSAAVQNAVGKDTVTIELPPAARWVRCVSPDFALSYDEVCRAIEAAGFVLHVSHDALLSSTTARG